MTPTIDQHHWILNRVVSRRLRWRHSRSGRGALACCLLLGGWLFLFSGSAGAQAPPPVNFGVNRNAAPSTTDGPAARIAAASPTAAASAAMPSDPAALTGEQPTEAEGASIGTHGLLTVVRQGGVLMLPIIACSIVLLVFVLERLFYLRRGNVIPRPFVRGVLEQLSEQTLDADEALALCEENGSPVAQVFAHGVRKWGKPSV
ncbi:MAG: hypothetical protein D6753_00370, partial [Planctomycetota bacterium]